MRRTPSGRREAGGAIVWTIVAVALVACVYYGYQALVFYRANVAPAVAEVSKVADAVKGYLPTFKLTRDPDEVANMLRSALRIAPPEGYAGAFGFTFELVGKLSQMVALAPQGVPASQIFEGGRGEIRFNPGPHTIFLAARSDRADRDEMREAISKMLGGDAQTEPLQPVFIEAGGKRVAAYVGGAQNYGARNKLVFVFLDDGRLFHAAGPANGFDEAALVRALAAIVAAHPANELLYTHPKADTVMKPANDPCGIAGLPDDFEVVMISVSRGSTPLDVTLDKSGRDVAREEIVVGATPKPIVLILSGNDPIVWNVGQAVGARIAGILAEGVYRQAVIGIPKTTRITSYSSADGPNACRYFHAERGQTADYKAADRRVRELFGRNIGTFMDRKGGARFEVGEVSGDGAYAPDRTLASVALPADVLPGGQKGIDRLVKQKALRPASDEDIDAWVKGAAQRAGQPMDAYRRRMAPFLRSENAYVVLRSFELPEGLEGAHSRTFLIPAGADRPSGRPGHNTFLTMEGFQCSGPGCQ